MIIFFQSKMFALPTLIVIVLILSVLYLIKKSKEKPENFPPGLPRLPLYGSYWFLLWVNYKYFHKSLIYYAKKYNTNILGFHLGDFPSIAAFDYETCKEILARPEFTLRPFPIVVYERCMGKFGGIFFGNEWREQRWLGLRYLRDFGFGRRSYKIENYTENEIRHLIDTFMSDPKKENQDVCKQKGVVYMPDVYQGHLLNIILLVLTGTRYDYQKLRTFSKMHQIFLSTVDASGCAISFTPWLRFIAPEFFGFNAARRYTKPILDFLKEEIREHKATFISGYPRDFVDMYLEELEKLKENPDDNTSMSEYELLMTTFDFFFPTTAALGQVMNILFAYLIHHPNVQKKIQHEIDEVVGKGRLPTLDDRINMPYVEAAIRESLRICPLNPVGITRMTSETTTLRGYTIPKGTLVYPCVYAFHNDPKLWGDPENYRPERWLDQNGKLIKRDCTLPFGGGKRLCAGETFARHTMFLILSSLLQHFTLVTPENEQKPDLINLVAGLNMIVAPYWMQAIER